MEYLLFCFFIIPFILIGLNILYKRKYNKKIQYEIEKEKEKYIQKNKYYLESTAREQLADLYAEKERVEGEIRVRLTNLSEIQKAYDELSESMRTQRESAKTYEEYLRKSAQEMAKTYEADLMKIADARVEEERQKMQKAAQQSLEKTMAEMATQTEAARAQIEVLTKEIAEYSAKQAAINEAILRQRALEEQQDFYRICLGPEAANDVEILNSARRNLKKPEIIDKIIYDNYIAKPVLEMVKRVLQNTTCSGIYKITCLKTGEIYIGKSTDIKNRWQQHCKTVFNCGTIASSLLHTKMKQYGIDNFTFELVEQVPKDQLSEREKFYISFYQSKEVGLNERQG